ncbi:class I SAM-dependent RNA methyltransferase [Eubacteriales bacterium KG127]
MKFELIATATFGLEAVVRREVESLGYTVIKTEDGKVTYEGDIQSIVKSNLWLRTADRVLLKMSELETKTFQEVFQGIKNIPWEEVIPVDGCFVVSGTSVKSRLTSLPALQRTIKKAIVERLSCKYDQPLNETGAAYPVKFTLLKDVLTISIDTSGAGLHKRGYRQENVAAPIKETLAAALVQLSLWNQNRLLIDPCCGSGTLLIEAAMIGRNIAPGLTRTFAASEWELIPKDIWKEEKKLAYEAVDYSSKLKLVGFDIDAKAVKSAQFNAEAAGVEEDILFRRASIKNLKTEDIEVLVEQKIGGAIIITNPPYGVRIGEEDEIKIINKALKRIITSDSSISLFVITTDRIFERKMGRKSSRRRKLYNGRMETTYFQFHGEKPKRK